MAKNKRDKHKNRNNKKVSQEMTVGKSTKTCPEKETQTGEKVPLEDLLAFGFLIGALTLLMGLITFDLWKKYV